MSWSLWIILFLFRCFVVITKFIKVYSDAVKNVFLKILQNSQENLYQSLILRLRETHNALQRFA